VMQRTSEYFLANACFTQQKYGYLAVRRLLEQFIGGMESLGFTNYVSGQLFLLADRRTQLHDLSLQVDKLLGNRLAVEKAHILGRVLPFLDRLADDAAVVLAHTDAF